MLKIFSRNKALTALLIILLIIPVLGWYLSEPLLLKPGTKEFITTILNGFWTAYFALIFLGISTLLQRINKRQVQHYNSLVNLGAQLNEMIGIIKDNTYVMDGFKKTILKGNIHWANFNTIIIDKSHYENLYDIDLINRVFKFFYSVRKINDDIEALKNGYNELKNAYIQKLIPIDQYIENAKLISTVIDNLIVFYEELLDEVIKLMARVRILMYKDKPFTSLLMEKLIYTGGISITAVELEEEITQIENELELSTSDSKKEIKKVLKKRKK